MTNKSRVFWSFNSGIRNSTEKDGKDRVPNGGEEEGILVIVRVYIFLSPMQLTCGGGLYEEGQIQVRAVQVGPTDNKNN